ncbi:MAG: hypothetical protein VXZ96_12655 [Myxococcota bacterium]|nr:hypothetical protein [Myxococcota bacterium]
MSLIRRAFVAGGGCSSFIGKFHPDFIWKKHPDFGTKENPTYSDYIKMVVDDLIKTTGVNPEDVDRLYLGNFVGELFVNQGHMGAALAGAHPAFDGKPAARLEAACASGGLAMLAGLDAIAAGADIVLVAGVEIQTTASARAGGDYLARASDYVRQRSIDDFTFPALFARRVKACYEAYGLSEEDLSHTAVKAYANGNKNPLAHMKAVKMDFEGAMTSPKFLSNEDLQPYMRMSDCSQVSDGATALLLVSEKGLAKIGMSQSDAVEVVGRGHAVGSLFKDSDPTVLTNSSKAVQQAYHSAGVGVEDISVAEVHDCFTVTELLMMEAMGLCKKGEAGATLRSGATGIDGTLPINTGGGLVAFGHPVGATGVKQALEIFRQMKGQCGEYQIQNQPKYGLTINMGGDDRTAVSLVLKNG